MSMTANEIMTSPAISVKPEYTLKEVVDLLSQHKISGAPVVDNEKKLVGIITDGDIMRFSSKTHVISVMNTYGWASPHTDINSIARFREGFEILTCTRTEQVMSKRIHSVQVNTPEKEIARLMKRRRIDRVPVVDKNSCLLGIITRTDLVDFLAGKEKNRQEKKTAAMLLGSTEELNSIKVPTHHAIKTEKQVVFSAHRGWESHVMRIFTMDQGGGTHPHEHEWPHWVLVLEGQGVLSFDGEEHPLEKGAYIFIPRDERHSFKNTGENPFIFLCIVPTEGEN